MGSDRALHRCGIGGGGRGVEVRRGIELTPLREDYEPLTLMKLKSWVRKAELSQEEHKCGVYPVLFELVFYSVDIDYSRT